MTAPADSMSAPVSTAAAAAPAPAWAVPGERLEQLLRWLFGAALLARLLYPFFNTPLSHIWSDPQRHWENGQRFLEPGFMGSSDPFMYQLWLFLLQQIKGNVAAVIPTGAGLLCAAMPYGWYRAFKELMPRQWALGGALLMALVPGFTGIYGYFMNETLLLTLTGFAFWATFRAHRKRSVDAFSVACALWLIAGFTRTTALPMGLLCLLSIWLPQPQKLLKAALGVVMLLILAIPAGMHGRVRLGYFAPLGNGYLPQVYNVSGNRNIWIGLGSQGAWEFGSPSFYNPTFYPFSDWTTDRTGVVRVHIDPSRGRADWIAEKARAVSERSFPVWRGYWENFLYLGFSQSWPDNDLHTVMGWLTVWTRWIWMPLVLAVGVGAWRGRFLGREWLLPACALGVFLYMLVQHDGVMEGRYRKPVDAVFVAAAVVMTWRRRTQPVLRPTVTWEPLQAALAPALPWGRRRLLGEGARAAAAPRRSRAAALARQPALALGALLCVALAVWLVLPRLSATGQVSPGGSAQPVTLPWTFHQVVKGNRLEVQLHGSWLTPGRWSVVPDDHLTSLQVNGQEVPLSRVRPGGVDDWEHGFDIDLSAWLRHGDNHIVFMLDNGGGDGGLSLQPLLGWRWLLLGISFLPWLLLLARWFRLQPAQGLILGGALLLYCLYLSATSWNQRTHDVGGDGGHLGHVAYIAEHLALPPPNAGWTFYHPPLYYSLGAVVYRAAQAAGVSVTQCLQLLALALYLVFLTASAGTLRLVLRGAPGKLALATLALALWPSGIIHGLSLGNDAALYACAGVATWFMLRWWRSGRRDLLLGMALFIALAFLAKTNAIVLAASAALLLLARLLHHPRRAALLTDTVLAGAIIALGLALSMAKQFYYHWHGEMPNLLIGNIQNLTQSLRVPVTLHNFASIDLRQFVATPWLDPYDDATGRANFWQYLLRSSLSGEFRFGSGLQRAISYTWGVLLLWLLWLLLLPRRSLQWTPRSAWREAPWLALGLLWLASLAALRIGTPYSCSNDMRYIEPILVPFILACVRGSTLMRRLLLLLVLGTVPFVAAL